MSALINETLVALWSICFCVAKDHPGLRVLAQVMAVIHVLLALASMLWR